MAKQEYSYRLTISIKERVAEEKRQMAGYMYKTKKISESVLLLTYLSIRGKLAKDAIIFD